MSIRRLGETGPNILVSTILGVAKEPSAANNDVATQRSRSAVSPTGVRAVKIVCLDVTMQTHFSAFVSSSSRGLIIQEAASSSL